MNPTAETPTESHALALPQIAAACPTCGAAPSALCTSHNGTRLRRHDTHTARRRAFEEQQATA